MVRITTQVTQAENPAGPFPELPNGLRYVARQPILDLRGQVRGYELLFRSGPEEAFRGDGDLATRTMLDNMVIFGLDQLSCGLTAFVNCTGESLISGMVEVLPPAGTVLEVLESVEPTEELVAACKRLKGLGFRIALDDFTWKPGIDPLLELADYIKVDFLATGPEKRRELLWHLHRTKAILLAEKIETQEDYRQACEEGFTFFQGYYFYRPILLKNRKVPANSLLHLDLLKQVQCEPLNVPQLSHLIKRDPALTLRMLKLANSPFFGIRQEVRSIQMALVVMGDEMLRRVLTLAIASEWNAGRPSAILHVAFVRGRFCELAASLCGLAPTEQYLLGMLSLLPAMLRLSMRELTPTLPLRGAIREALEGNSNRERILLDWLEHYERAEWVACDAVAEAGCLNQMQMAKYYTQAVLWAEAALGETSSPGV